MRVDFDPNNHQHDDGIENKSRMLLVTSGESLYHRANAMPDRLALNVACASQVVSHRTI